MLADLKKSANILDQKQGLAAGLNFLPAVSARKFTPEEMIETYKITAANGGRIGFNEGLLARPTAQQGPTKEPITIDVNEGKNYTMVNQLKNIRSKDVAGRRKNLILV
jgi:hypothetical protein